MKSDINVLKIYMGMLLDGSAFSNWKNPPDSYTRQQLVESILQNENFRGDRLSIESIQRVVTESQNTKQLKRLMEEMFIDENEFKV